jgi:hypothetical protein
LLPQLGASLFYPILGGLASKIKKSWTAVQKTDIMNITTGTALGKTYTTEVPDELIFIYSKHVYFRAHIEGGAGVQID